MVFEAIHLPDPYDTGCSSSEQLEFNGCQDPGVRPESHARLPTSFQTGDGREAESTKKDYFEQAGQRLGQELVGSAGNIFGGITGSFKSSPPPGKPDDIRLHAEPNVDSDKAVNDEHEKYSVASWMMAFGRVPPLPPKTQVQPQQQPRGVTSSNVFLLSACDTAPCVNRPLLAPQPSLRLGGCSTVSHFVEWGQRACGDSGQGRLAVAADKILRRWRSLAVTPAMSRWLEYAQEMRRKRWILAKITLRWRHVEMAPAMRQWMVHVREGQRMRRTADKIVRRRQNTCLAPAFTVLKKRWVELKGLRNVGGKAILRWQRLSLARGLSGWKDQAVHQRRVVMAADKIMRRWSHLSIGPAMSRWVQYVDEKKQLARAAAKVVSRMRRMELCVAFSSLQEAAMVARDTADRHSEMRTREHAANKAADRRRRQAQGRAWACWYAEHTRQAGVKQL